MLNRNSANLDYLRSVAVIAVMIDHLVPTLANHGTKLHPFILAFTATIGQAGVLAFFVHTSLVLMYSLERLQQFCSGNAELAYRFYVRRVFRIYPLALATIVLVLALGIPAMTWRETPPITTTVVIANLLLVQNIVTGQSVLGPLWSLPYEMQMYVFLPALWLLARPLAGAKHMVLLFILFSVLGLVLAQFTNGKLNLLAYVPCFVCGALCYALRLHIKPVIHYAAWIPFVLMIVIVYCLLHIDRTAPVYWIGWIYCLAIGVSINAFADSKFHSFNALSEKTATYSYGLYLLHVPVLYLVFDVLQINSIPFAVVAYFALTVITSIGAFHLLELPFIEIGKRLSEGKVKLRALRDHGA